MKVYASVASFAPREEALGQMVASILPQVDRLHVYLNDYGDVPEVLQHERVRVVRGHGAAGDIGDAGKFFFQEHIDEDVVWFTCDDDLLYPPDYVERMSKNLALRDHGIALSCHGTLLAPPDWKYRGAQHFRCLRGVSADTRVHVLGTGVLAFRLALIRPRLADFPVPNMADLWFAKLLQEKRIGSVVMAHERGWLRLLVPPAADSIWNRGELEEARSLLRSVDWQLY